jgi:hypothetical protein
VELISSCIWQAAANWWGLIMGPLHNRKCVQTKGLPNSELISSSWKELLPSPRVSFHIDNIYIYISFNYFLIDFFKKVILFLKFEIVEFFIYYDDIQHVTFLFSQKFISHFEDYLMTKLTLE